MPSFHPLTLPVRACQKAGPGKKSQIWAWGYKNKAPADVEYAVKLTKEGYRLEVTIPFTEVNKFYPVKDYSIGFSISIHDRDINNKAKKLTWSIDSASQPGKIFFGTLRLKDK